MISDVSYRVMCARRARLTVPQNRSPSIFLNLFLFKTSNEDWRIKRCAFLKRYFKFNFLKWKKVGHLQSLSNLLCDLFTPVWFCYDLYPPHVISWPFLRTIWGWEQVHYRGEQEVWSSKDTLLSRDLVALLPSHDRGLASALLWRARSLMFYRVISAQFGLGMSTLPHKWRVVSPAFSRLISLFLSHDLCGPPSIHLGIGSKRTPT